MGRVVLVTGAATPLGAETARRLVDDAAVARVVAVDVVPPAADLGGARFVRADLRNPVMAELLGVEGVDTVLHLTVAEPPARAGSSRGERNVIGTMQLLAACQRAAGVRSLVLSSSTGVYGASPRDPAVFTEDTVARQLPRTGYAKDCAENEGYLRGFARRRPDVAITVLRCADLLGAGVDGPLARYLRLPVVPTVLGFDPRLQVLHPDDAAAALARATVNDLEGTYNLAGDGAVTLSQLVRRLGRPSLPVPRGVGLLGQAMRRVAGAALPADEAALLTYGRVVDTTALKERFGLAPRWSTPAAVADFGSFIGSGLLDPECVQRVERALGATVGAACAATATGPRPTGGG
ncbi:MAG: NAD-dependent epimerase/dehydratase family protein [Nocardioidaceae bacterium]|nr:NAD-dependent epimerase/dehydratase family protein [Nocardioidaceae bacterium]